MKVRKLILLGIFTVLTSCKPEAIGIFQCFVDLTIRLDELDELYSEGLSEPDSMGNDQSLESCLNRRNLTKGYILVLDDGLDNLNNNERCSDEEIDVLASQMRDRQEDLREDLEVVWSQCEAIFGG